MIKGFRQPAGGLAELDRQYDCACDLITVGRRKEAETLLCGILKKYPSHFGALCSLGAIRLEQAQVDEAMQLFRRAASYRPGSAEAHESLGNALQAMGRHEEAVYSYRRALNLRPQSLYTHNNLANSYMALGKLAEAVECLRQTIALLPGLEAAHSNLGNVLLALGRPEEALAAYQAALSLNPGLGGLHNNFGRALVALNRHEEALRHFVRARDLDPGVTQAPLNVALARLALGDYAAAWPDYETRWQSYPGLRTYAQPFWDGCADLAGKNHPRLFRARTRRHHAICPIRAIGCQTRRSSDLRSAENPDASVRQPSWRRHVARARRGTSRFRLSCAVAQLATGVQDRPISSKRSPRFLK